jgi:hypothetical protein
MALAGATEVAQRQGQLGHAHQCGCGLVEILERAGPAGEHVADGARVHLLETQHQHAVHHAALDGLAAQEQGGGAGGAVVVDVDDGDARHAHLVQRLLAAGGVAIDIARIGLLHGAIVQPGVGQRQPHGLGHPARKDE